MKDCRIFFLIALAVFVFDQATKQIILSKLDYYESISVLSFFSIVHVHNTGSAFGMFRSLGNGFFVSISIAAVAGISYMLVKDPANRPGYALVLGGAAGNLADRLRHGFVVDFLDFFAGRHHWPAFNVADSALTVGIALLMINTFLEAGREKSAL